MVIIAPAAFESAAYDSLIDRQNDDGVRYILKTTEDIYDRV